LAVAQQCAFGGPQLEWAEEERVRRGVWFHFDFSRLKGAEAVVGGKFRHHIVVIGEPHEFRHRHRPHMGSWYCVPLRTHADTRRADFAKGAGMIARFLAWMRGHRADPQRRDVDARIEAERDGDSLAIHVDGMLVGWIHGVSRL